MPETSEYSAFAQSPLWDLQRQYYSEKGLDAWAQAQVPHYVTSHPFMANAYAQIVLGFWRDLKAQGLTGDQPLYIIELGSGCGRFAYHFLLQFFEAFDAIRGPDDRVCYVMTDFNTKTLEHWRERLLGRLDPFIQQGRLDFALFDVESDSEVVLQNQGITLTAGSLTLPPVVIANYVLGSIRQDLFFLEKERLFEGWIKTASGSESSANQPFAKVAVEFQKRRIATPDYPAPLWNQLIERYAGQLPPCALLFPSYALNTLERLSRLNDGRLLWLSADRGSHGLKHLGRPQEPDFAYHGSFSLPVNYLALTDIVQANGGICWHGPDLEGLNIVAACWRTPYAGAWRETARAAQLALQGFNANDFYRIKQALEAEAEYLTPDQMLAFLRLSRWDTKVFYLTYRHAYDFLAQLPESSQQAWYEALREVWRVHLPIGEDFDLAFDLGCLAVEMNRWSAAIEWFSQSFVYPDPKPRPGQHLSCVHFNIGVAHWQLAAYKEAKIHLLKALELHPEKASDEIDTHGRHQQAETRLIETNDIHQHLNDLQAWHSRCQHLLGGTRLELPAGSTITPGSLFSSLLGCHQAQALYRLQRDPQLCRLAGVECLTSTEHAQDWIGREQHDQSHLLALLHAQSGLVGVAALKCPPAAFASTGSGHFYYWIGTEHQNLGYGSQALLQLQHLAEIRGVRHLFSAVDQANTVSRRLMEKSGFQRLPFKLNSKRSGFHYYHSGPPASAHDLHRILSELLAEMDNGTTLQPLIPGGAN